MIPAALALVVSLLVGGGYLSSRNGACASCHAPQAKQAAASAHASISCYDCHLGSAWDFLEQKNSEIFRMYPRALGGVKLDGPGRRIARGACTRCHEGGPPDTLEAKGLRISHADCAAAPALCDDCHGTVAHGTAVRWSRRPVMDDCLACHARNSAPVKCDTCHAGRLERERLTSGPWQVTHGPKWQQTHGMGDLDTCSSCHEPAKCIGCHKTEIPHPISVYNSHGKEARAKDARCYGCHQDKSWCTSCHGIEMPHPVGFLKRHSKIAKSYKDSSCLHCHAPEDCVNCHVAHTHRGLNDGTRLALPPKGGDR